MTWTTYPIKYNGYTQTADPAVAFDADGTAYLATVGALDSQNPNGIGSATAPDIIVVRSSDGGRPGQTPCASPRARGRQRRVARAWLMIKITSPRGVMECHCHLDRL